MSEESGCPVKVYVYDLSKGMARSLSQPLLGKQIDGIWHTGVVVYGQEFYFGGTGGIESCPPGGTILGSPDSIEDMGVTQVPYEMFLSYLSQLATSSFKPSSYHLLENNCNTFSSEVSQFLTGKDIPSKITGLPADVLSTPLGQMMKPWVDAMSVQPSGGHAVFPMNSTGESSGTAGAEGGQTETKSASNGPTTEWEKTMSNDWVEPEDPKEEAAPAVVFTEKPLDRKQFHDQIFEKLPMKELGLISDIYDYLSEGDNPSWSLGKDHIQTLHTVIGDGRLSETARANVCTILQSLVLRTDFLALIQRDPTQLVLKIMEHFEQLPEAVQVPFLKMLTNCCSKEPGHKFLTTGVVSSQESDQTFLTTEAESVQTDMLKWTVQTCVSCLLKDKVSINECGSAFAFNLSRFGLSDDTQVEIGSALLENLQRETNEATVFNLLSCLLLMMESNIELCDLAGVVGLNASQHQKLSARVRSLCEKAQQLSAL